MFEVLQLRGQALRGGLVVRGFGSTPAPSVSKNLTYTLGQLLKEANNCGLDAEISFATIDAFLIALSRRGVRPATKHSRVKEIILFAREINTNQEVTNYLIDLKKTFERETRRAPKRKEIWLFQNDLDLAAIRLRAEHLAKLGKAGPSHAASSCVARRDAALLALVHNAPLRMSDIRRLRLGREIFRSNSGWRLALEQAKTGQYYEIARLDRWVGGVLDSFIVDGRTDADAIDRAAALQGQHLFASKGRPPSASWPSRVFQRHFGAGIHLVRSLWATHFAEHRPDDASWAAPALLGHKSELARRAYEVGVTRNKSVRTAQLTIEELVRAAGSAALQGELLAPLGSSGDIGPAGL